MISPEDRHRLLSLARRALEARVLGESEPPAECGGALDEIYGAFVSIHRDGELRGCLGRLELDWPLAQVVLHLAAVVADSDPRFVPVTAHEVSALDIEISVLTPEHQINGVDEIDIGRHGLIVEHGSRRGVLLPQVPIEHDWDRTAFVQHTCLKAGLASDAWRTGAKMFVFEAEVFAEHG